MKKLLCCLIGAGTLLFWAACSDDKTSISVESPNPGDLVGTESDVRCDVARAIACIRISTMERIHRVFGTGLSTRRLAEMFESIGISLLRRIMIL